VTGAAAIFSAATFAFATAVAADWSRCSRPTSVFDRQTCGMGEHPTPLRILAVSLIVVLGVSFLAVSILLTRRPKSSPSRVPQSGGPRVPCARVPVQCVGHNARQPPEVEPCR
jgi:hypothetical protein